MSNNSIYDNLRAAFLSADDKIISEGMVWYTEARAIVKEIARVYQVTENLVAAVMAAASVNTYWHINIEKTWLYVAQLAKNGQAHGGHFGFVIDRINEIWSRRRDYAKIVRGANGLKIEAFYRNLSGNRQAVTVDRHMKRAAGLSGDKATTKQNEAVTEAVCRLAKEFGVLPEQVQAIIWLVQVGK